MAGTNLTGMMWDKSGTANTIETTAALAVWDANNCKARKISITNDGSIDLLYRLNIDAEPQLTLAAGENILHNIVSNGLQVDCASSCAFRCIGEG